MNWEWPWLCMSVHIWCLSMHISVHTCASATLKDRQAVVHVLVVFLVHVYTHGWPIESLKGNFITSNSQPLFHSPIQYYWTVLI